jgi:formamidopyrimidine-DNA glycosylase
VPELPDLEIYIESLRSKVMGRILQAVRLRTPFLLRTVDPPLSAARGKKVCGITRIGKHIVLQMEREIYLVIHLMVSGRFLWRGKNAPIQKKIGLAAFDFENGTLLLTEAGTKRRASLHVIRGEEGLRVFDRGGIELLDSDLESFSNALRRENHTLKRALTDPRLISGIGNAYSDEILHRARLSPLKLTSRLTDDEIEQLYRTSRQLIIEWIQRLREFSRSRTGNGFPEKVTAFQEGFAVHGRFQKPCPECGTPVQRIVYAENECNYCPRCQTGGKVLADRALSRLLKGDWPKSLNQDSPT